jgi:N-acetylneuraminate synthase/N,N'-diacetyllegionaminate synthase
MPSPIRIGSREIGPDSSVWIVAEAGVNHNGDLATAERLVVEAKQAGADCVKFQTFVADRIATPTAPKTPYQLVTTDQAEPQVAMLRKLELDEASHRRLIEVCREQGITFLSTPYDVEDVDLLESLGVDAYKVASALLVEPHLLRRLAATGKPIIVATGLATLDEVSAAVETLNEAGHDQLVLLQCTTDYPAAASDANLRAMQTMASAFDVLVGYSDHTQTPTAAIAATALGAVMIEKHFTLDRSLPGPDHSASADPAEFVALVRSIREAESALGSGEKRPSPAELENLTGMRRALVVTRPLPAGTVLDASMLAPKRPATGIAPRELDRLAGRRTKIAINEDQPLEWWMLE